MEHLDSLEINGKNPDLGQKNPEEMGQKDSEPEKIRMPF